MQSRQAGRREGAKGTLRPDRLTPNGLAFRRDRVGRDLIAAECGSLT